MHVASPLVARGYHRLATAWSHGCVVVVFCAARKGARAPPRTAVGGCFRFFKLLQNVVSIWSCRNGCLLFCCARWAEHQIRSNNVASTATGGGGGGTGGGTGTGSRSKSRGNIGDGGGGVGGGDGSLVNNLFSSPDGTSSGNINIRSSPELITALGDNANAGADAGAGWGGDRAALAVAAVAAASGGQGGGFRPDGGAVAFVPPVEWPGNKASPPPFLFNRVDLDSRPSVTDKKSSAQPTGAAAATTLDVTTGSVTLMTRDSGREGGRAARRGSRAGKLWPSGAGAGGGKGKAKVRKAAEVAAEVAAAAATAAPLTAVTQALAEQAPIEQASVRTPAGAGRRGAGAGAGTASRKTSTAGARGGRASASPPGPASAAETSAAPTVACRTPGCSNKPNGRTPFCWDHWSAARQCQHAGCEKLSQGNTRLCIAHGGGRRCTHPGCNKGARDRFFCAAHGGGKRCSVADCGKAAVGGSDLCTGHGGGKRCQVRLSLEAVVVFCSSLLDVCFWQAR